jgi:hypothetical protein
MDMILKSSKIIGAINFTGKLFGNTMLKKSEKSVLLMQGLGVKLKTVYANQGYFGVN